jgi:hypothetical protein
MHASPTTVNATLFDPIDESPSYGRSVYPPSRKGRTPITVSARRRKLLSVQQFTPMLEGIQVSGFSDIHHP